MTASGCVWSTCVAGDERVQQRLDRRPRLVGRRARSGAGSRPSRRRPSPRARAAAGPRRGGAPGKPAAVIVARSVPEPLTQSTRVSRPAWSSDVSFGGGVAAALVRERAVGAEQVRAVDEPVEHAEAAAAAPSQRSSGAGIPCRTPVSSLMPRTSSAGSVDERRSALVPRAIRRVRPARRASARTTRARPRAPRRATRSRRAPSPARAGSRARSPPPGPRAPAGRPRSAVQRQSSSLRAPPPTTWISRGDRAGDRREHVDRLACFSARLSRMQRTIAPGSPGSGWPVAAQNARIRAGMSPGSPNAGVVGVDERAQGGRVLRKRDELVERVALPASRPRRGGTRGSARAQ